MEIFLINVLLFFLVYQFGRASGKIEERLRLGQALHRGNELYNKVITLAKLKGEDPDTLSKEEIVARVEKLMKDTQEQEPPY